MTQPKSFNLHITETKEELTQFLGEPMARSNIGPIRKYTIDYYSLFPISEKRSKPGQHLAMYSFL